MKTSTLCILIGLLLVGSQIYVNFDHPDEPMSFKQQAMLFANLFKNSFSVISGVPVVAEDNDKDGYTSDLDCNDNDYRIHPSALEKKDGIDNDCDSLIDECVGKEVC